MQDGSTHVLVEFSLKLSPREVEELVCEVALHHCDKVLELMAAGGREGGRRMKHASETTAVPRTGRFVVAAVAIPPILQLWTKTRQNLYFSAQSAGVAVFCKLALCMQTMVAVCLASSPVLR